MRKWANAWAKTPIYLAYFFVIDVAARILMAKTALVGAFSGAKTAKTAKNPKNRRTDSRPAQNILILRTDAIGDYLLFRDFLAEVKRANPDANITLLGNKSWQNLAETLDSALVSRFIWLEWARFHKKFRYPITFLAALKAQKYDILLDPVFSRDVPNLLIFKAARAGVKIAPKGDFINLPPPLKKLGEWGVTLLPSTPKIIFEFERNREFFEAFLGKKLATKPFIDRAKLAAAANKSLKAKILGRLDSRDSPDSRQDLRGGDSRDLRDSQRGAGVADSPQRDSHPEDSPPSPQSKDSRPKVSPVSPPRFCVLFIGASAAFRKYSPLGFAQVGAFVAQKYGLRIILASGKEDAAGGKIIEHELAKSRITALNLVAQTTLSELGFVIAHAALLVSNETSAAHFGAILKTPTIVLSNGNHFGRFLPYPAALSPHYRAVLHPTIEAHPARYEELSNAFAYKSSLDINEIAPSRVIAEIEALNLELNLAGNLAENLAENPVANPAPKPNKRRKNGKRI